MFWTISFCVCEAQKAKKMGKILNQATRASSNAHRDIFTSLFELLLNKMLFFLGVWQSTSFPKHEYKFWRKVRNNLIFDSSALPSPIDRNSLSFLYFLKWWQTRHSLLEALSRCPRRPWIQRFGVKWPNLNIVFFSMHTETRNEESEHCLAIQYQRTKSWLNSHVTNKFARQELNRV